MEKIIVALKEIYDLYREPVTNEALALLVRNLKHYDPDVVLKALESLKLTRTITFAPKYPDFLEYIKKTLLAEYKSADSAWGDVIVNVRRGHKGYANLDPLVQQAVDKVCGWDALRTTDNLLYYRSAFINVYNSVIEEDALCTMNPSKSKDVY